MSPAFPARRRAEQFDAAVEGTSTSSLDAASGDLLELVATLRTMPRAEPRAEFVAALRDRLMLAAATELTAAHGTRAATGPVIRPQRTHRDRRLATALGGFALVGATASMAVAAQSSLPGDELYPMKRAMENAHAQLSVGNDAKGATLLANASGRLDEVDELTHGDHAGDAGAGVIADTLTAFTDQATEASDLLLDAYAADGDETAISELTAFTESSLDTLDGLVADVPADAREALAEARRTIASIEGAAAEACPLCAAVLSADPVSAALGPQHGAHAPHTVPHIVRPPAILVVPHPTTAPSTAAPGPDPSEVPAPEPTVIATPTPSPSATEPSATGLPTHTPSGSSQPDGGSAGQHEDDDPLADITQGVHVSNPNDPAAAVSEAAEAVAGAVGGILGGSDRPAAGHHDADDGADAPDKGVLGP